MSSAPDSPLLPPAPPALNIPRFEVPRSLVLVGMMGAGKSSVGKHLAAWLGWNFVDSDIEIEAVFGRKVSDIFAEYGEAVFRAQEQKIMRQLLQSAPCVIASGGGAFINEDTRAAVRESAISIWLDVPMDELMQRVLRRPTRPLLQQPNPREIMEKLDAARRPIYAQADIVVKGNGAPSLVSAARAAQSLKEFLENKEKS